MEFEGPAAGEFGDAQGAMFAQGGEEFPAFGGEYGEELADVVEADAEIGRRRFAAFQGFHHPGGTRQVGLGRFPDFHVEYAFVHRLLPFTSRTKSSI